MPTEFQTLAETAREALEKFIVGGISGGSDALSVPELTDLETAVDILNDAAGPQLYEVEIEATVTGTVEVEANSEAEAEQAAISAVENGSAEACYIEAETSDLYFEMYPTVGLVEKV